MRKTDTLPWAIAITALILALAAFVDTGALDEPEEEKMEYASVAPKGMTQWDIFTLAIASVESEFNPMAESQGCRGILQITPVYVQEVNRIYGTDYTIDDAFDADKSLEMHTLMQAAKNPEKDFKKALDVHNPNHPQSYEEKVYRKYNEFLQYEGMRDVTLMLK